MSENEYPALRMSNEAGEPLTMETMERGFAEMLRRHELRCQDELRDPRPRMVLTDQQIRACFAIGFDPNEAYQVIRPVTLEELETDEILSANQL